MKDANILLYERTSICINGLIFNVQFGETTIEDNEIIEKIVKGTPEVILSLSIKRVQLDELIKSRKLSEEFEEWFKTSKFNKYSKK